MRDRLAEFIYTLCYIGYFPLGSGTIASAGACIFYYFLNPSALVYCVLLAGLFLISLWGTPVAIRRTGKPDPQIVVIDEALGMLVAVGFLPPGAFSYVLAFFAFRFFDVMKTFPVGSMERLPGAWGVVMDDVVAGLYANAVVQVLYLVRPVGL
ncbi:MAG: phosphatidylglycerophosphatase A [Candidatus Omnitrophica bacterium]|nr:phosphatidylglycerophosphatase A [Candidatus Omnitrophota bacterium]